MKSLVPSVDNVQSTSTPSARHGRSPASSTSRSEYRRRRSGKGGVDEGAISAVCRCLRHDAAEVGVLDADITGRTSPSCSGSKANHTSKTTRSSLKAYGVKVISVGFLMPRARPSSGGPMLHKAIQQLFTDVRSATGLSARRSAPGTGDAQLSLARRAPDRRHHHHRSPGSLGERRLARRDHVPALGSADSRRGGERVSEVFGSGSGQRPPN